MGIDHIPLNLLESEKYHTEQQRIHRGNDQHEKSSGGIMVKKADDAAAYSKAIRHLLKNTDNFEKLGQENVNRSRLFQSEVVMEKMSEIYRRILMG